MTPSVQPSSSRNSGAIVPVSADKVKVWDFRAAGVLDASRLAPLSAANEVFGRNLAQELSRRFEVPCEISVRSIDLAVCEAFFEGAGASLSYFHALILGSHAETSVLQLDLLVLLSLLDCLMGGTGKSFDTARELTEIEGQMATEIVKVIAQELQSAWQSYAVGVKVGNRQMPDHLLHTLAPSATALVPTFDIRIAEISGKFQLMLPIPSIAPFLKPETGKVASPSGMPASSMSPRLSRELLGARFSLSLAVARAKLPAKQILDLALGQVLNLGAAVEVPVTMNIGGRAAFAAMPVRSGDHKAAHLLERIVDASKFGGENR